LHIRARSVLKNSLACIFEAASGGDTSSAIIRQIDGHVAGMRALTNSEYAMGHKRIPQANDKGGLRVALILWSQPLRDPPDCPGREEFESEQY
jgi:hypothetical protein